MKSTFASDTFGSRTFASGTFAGVGAEAEPTPASCGTDVMAAGMAWLAGMLPTVMGQPLVYRRGAEAVAFCATPCQTKLLLSDEAGGARIEWTDRDFLIPAASLVLSGSKVLPKRGDVITQDDGEQVHTFQVLPYDGEPQWRWSDPYRRIIRVHTKRISTEPS